MRLPPWSVASLRPKRRVPKLWLDLAKLDHGGSPVPHESLIGAELVQDSSKRHGGQMSTQRNAQAFAQRRVNGSRLLVELFQGPPHMCHACRCASVVRLSLNPRQACRPTREILGRLPIQQMRAPLVRPVGMYWNLQLPDAAKFFASSLIRLFGYLSPKEAVGGEVELEKSEPENETKGGSGELAPTGPRAQSSPPGQDKRKAFEPAYISENEALCKQVETFTNAMTAIDRRLSPTEVQHELKVAWLCLTTRHLQILLRLLHQRVDHIGLRQPSRRIKLAAHPARSADPILLAREQLMLVRQGIMPKPDPPLYFPQLTDEERWAIAGDFLRLHVDALWRQDSGHESKVAADTCEIVSTLCAMASAGAINVGAKAWDPPNLDDLRDEDGDELVFLPEIWGSCMLRPSIRPVYP
eukprot:scaffold144287_cov31-Tisochrysis_lutea.AAC.1